MSKIDWTNIQQAAPVDPIFLEGAHAHGSQLPLMANPYPPDGIEHAKWNDGWQEAEYAKEYAEDQESQ